MPETRTREFLLPDLGEGLEEATIVAWLVAVGDTVELNQPLCTVETAKAEVDIPSPHAGAVIELGGGEGETLQVGALLVRIDEATAPAGGAPDTTLDPTRPRPTLVGYGHDASIDRSRRRAPAGVAPGRGAPPAGRPLAKPPVRKLARTLGVDLATVAPGSGPGGIVTRHDIEAVASGAESTGLSSVNGAGPAPAATDEIVPVAGVRARIAERMATARSRIPDATCSVVVDCSRLLDVRAELDGAWVRRGGEQVITPFALTCALAAQALRRNRRLNANFVEEVPEIRVHGSIHLGVGVSTPRGLVVAVVRDADRRSVAELAMEMARLRDGARSGTLRPDELRGSTFTVSNFGALGLDEGIPVINHPEAAILGVGAVRLRPHVVGDEVVARHTAALTLAFDHRVCDGVEAAGLLTDLRALIEAPELALLGT